MGISFYNTRINLYKSANSRTLAKQVHNQLCHFLCFCLGISPATDEYTKWVYFISTQQKTQYYILFSHSTVLRYATSFPVEGTFMNM